MTNENPIVERWARLAGHEFDLSAAADAFRHNSVCKIERDDDGKYYLKAPELYGVEDAWEFERLANEFLDRVNGAMAAGSQERYDPIIFGDFVAVHANGQKDVFILAGPIEFRARGGLVVATTSGKPAESKPSDAESWIELSATDDDLADALVFIGREASWFDLYKAYETVCGRMARAGHNCDVLFDPADASVRSKKLELFRHTANTLHRHNKKDWVRPTDPMTLAEARNLIVDLVCGFAKWLQANSVPKS